MMIERRFKTSILYDVAGDYFVLDGNAVMRLTPKAAMRVCDMSTEYGKIVSIIEGGFFHNPKFEARRDCVWWRPSIFNEDAVKAAKSAREFIKEKSEEHNAFIVSMQLITASPLSR